MLVPCSAKSTDDGGRFPGVLFHRQASAHNAEGFTPTEAAMTEELLQQCEFASTSEASSFRDDQDYANSWHHDVLVLAQRCLHVLLRTLWSDGGLNGH